MRETFRKFAAHISHLVGTAYAFVIALLIILTWLITGPMFNFSNTWQLFINSFTTVMTFLMVFLIQNTQNRDSKAVHLKLDELLKSIRGARDSMVNLEELSDDELETLHQKFRRIQTKNPLKIKPSLLSQKDQLPQSTSSPPTTQT